MTSLTETEVDNPDRTALYRLYAKDGSLLYVGITSNPDHRFAQHAVKDWWRYVDRREVEWYDSRASAAAAEEAAIKRHAPGANRQHSPDWPSVPVTLMVTPNMRRAMDILCRVLDIKDVTGIGHAMTAPQLLLWSLLDRELAARGLMGDPPCHHGGISWPDGVAVKRAGEECWCGRAVRPDGLIGAPACEAVKP